MITRLKMLCCSVVLSPYSVPSHNECAEEWRSFAHHMKSCACLSIKLATIYTGGMDFEQEGLP